MQVTVLIDNLTRSALTPEWGLSFYIEYNNRRILLDTGASARFAENALALGIDLSAVDAGVLSHAHYDHADGMDAFFARNDHAPFYIRAGAGENCYDTREPVPRYIGIRKGLMEAYKDRIVYADGRCEILPGVTLLPHGGIGTVQDGSGDGLCILEDGVMRTDTFAHEQSLVFDTPRGLVIFNSCSHGGADNIIREAAAAWPGRHICALLGGFHLYHQTEAQVRVLAGRIRDTGIDRICTGHCTGEDAFRILRAELGDGAMQLYTGLTLTL